MISLSFRIHVFWHDIIFSSYLIHVWSLLVSLCKQVKCLNCRHESERYENIMDLTLEIYGWVESLEDALTQFTTSEDLDAENMYRCGRFVNFILYAYKRIS